MFDIDFIYNGNTYNYREGSPFGDGFFLLDPIEKTFKKVSNVSLELQAEILNKKNSYNLDNYSQLRKNEYNKLNQLEMQYDDLINNTTTWQDKIQEIKAMFPKPSEE